MNKILHRADQRGYANHGWLEARHTFSFANYYNPENIHFGALRVLNDDQIAGGMGFGTHPHDNMEIITIPLQGALAHKDSMGNGTTIHAGDIQVMSAGTGIMHSEFNAHETESCQLLQIWVFPDQRQHQPRYGQMTLDETMMENHLLQIISPDPDDEGLWIHQQAWFHLGKFDSGKEFDYTIKKSGNGVYVFVIEGKVEVAGESLNRRDGLGIAGSSSLKFKTTETAKVLLMEVPMNF